MTRRTSLLVSLFIGLLIAGGLFFAAAAPEAQAQGIVQCSATGTDKLIGCDLCDLVKVINTIINIGAAALLGIGTIGIIVIGFLYITASANPGLLQQAKRAFVYAVTGMVIILLSFVLVKTVFTIAFDADSSNLFDIECKTPDLDTQAPPTSGGGTTTPSPGTGGGQTSTCQNSTAGQCAESQALLDFMNCFETGFASAAASNPEKYRTLGQRTTTQGTHNINSCHFGGRTCTDGGHAVDYGGQPGTGGDNGSFNVSEAILINNLRRQCTAPGGQVSVWAEDKNSNRYIPGTDPKELYQISDPKITHIHINVNNADCGCQ